MPISLVFTMEDLLLPLFPLLLEGWNLNPAILSINLSQMFLDIIQYIFLHFVFVSRFLMHDPYLKIFLLYRKLFDAIFWRCIVCYPVGGRTVGFPNTYLYSAEIDCLSQPLFILQYCIITRIMCIFSGNSNKLHKVSDLNLQAEASEDEEDDIDWEEG